MSKTEIQLYDGYNKGVDKAYIKNTNVEFYVAGTDKLLWRGRNKSVLTGAPFTIYNQFDIANETDIRLCMPNYDNFQLDNDGKEYFTLNIYNNIDYNTYLQNNIDKAKCYLWCVGKGGATSNPSQIIANEFASWIWPENLIPFRTIATSVIDDLDSNITSKYFGRKTIEGADSTETNYTAFYFKKIDDVNLRIKRINESSDVTDEENIKGTMEAIYREKYAYAGSYVVGEDVTSRSKYNTHETDCFVETLLKITNEDLREWFQVNNNSNIATEERGSLNNGAVSSLSLCEAVPIYDADGNVSEYCNITPLTKLNFHSELLGDLDKGIDIRYQLYY